MLRRVSWALRGLLLALGVILLVWLPISFWYGAYAVIALQEGGIVGVTCEDGIVSFLKNSIVKMPSSSGIDWQDPAYEIDVYDWTHASWPQLMHFRGDFDVTVPLWLLAV